MTFRAAGTGLLPAIALVLSTQTALAEAHADAISPTESALADLLISLAELELSLARESGVTLPPPPGGQDLLDQVNTRLILLSGVDIAGAAPQPEPPAEDELAAAPAPGDPAPSPLDASPPKADPAPVGQDDPGPDADIDPIAAAIGFAQADEPVTGPDAEDPGPAPRPAPAAKPPAREDEPFIAVSLNGTSVHSLLLEELSDADRALLPDAETCADLGAWFLSQPLQSELRSVFVIEGDYVRICRELGPAWLVKRATNRDRAHLVKRAE